MPKTLEGYVGDDRGEPFVGIEAIVTRVSDGVAIAIGESGPDGRWAFTDLGEADEHFVTLTDEAGRAAIRGPWSGELREAWVRDRLNVAGKPLVIDPAADNGLAWTSAGLYAPPAGITEAYADGRYINTTGTDTKVGQLNLTRGIPDDFALTVGMVSATIPSFFMDAWGTMQYSNHSDAWDTVWGRSQDGGMYMFGGPLKLGLNTDVPAPSILFSSSAVGPADQRSDWDTRLLASGGSYAGTALGTLTFDGGQFVFNETYVRQNYNATFYSTADGQSLTFNGDTDGYFGLNGSQGGQIAFVGGYVNITASRTPTNTLFIDANLDVGGTIYDSGVAVLTQAAADARYLQLTGGSVMTGLLGPTTNNTRDLGTTALRWRSAYLSGSLNFDDAIVDPRITFYSAPYFGIGIAAGMLKYSAGVATNRHSFQVAAVERFSVSDASVIAALPVNPDANNTRDLGTTALRWRALYGMTADLTTSLTVAAKPLVISPDAANIIEWRANGFYAAAGAVSDIWVNTAGDTMTGVLTMAADIIPDLASARALGSIAKPWADLWGVNGNFEGALTVANPGSSTAVNIGPLVSASTPLIRFRSSGLASSYDSRIAGTGGTATNGQGTLTLLAATVAVTGALTAGGNAVLTQATADPLYVNTTGDTMTGDLTLSATIARLIFNETDHTANSKNTRLWVDGGIFRIQAFDDAGNGGGVSLDITRVNNNWNTFSFNGHMSLGGTALYVDASQKLAWINKLTDPALPAGYTAQPGLLVQHEGAHLNGLSLARASSADTSPEILNFWRSRGTWASKVAIANADNLSQMTSWAWSGANWLASAAIQVGVTGTVTTTAVPTSMLFFTADSAGTLAARLSIGPEGNLTSNVNSVGVAGFSLYNVSNTAGNGWSLLHQGSAGNLGPVDALLLWRQGSSTGGVMSIRPDSRVALGANYNGTSSAQLDVKANSASFYTAIFTAHASHPNTLPFFHINNASLSPVFGVNNLGLVSNAYQGKTAFSSPVRGIPWYDSAGTFLGWMPLYSTAT